MSRHRGPSGPSISLFPFLAVLLCTMGALLVVLVIFSRSAASNASHAERAASDELESARDAIAARLAELERLKQHALDELKQARLRLAGIEDHARSLQDEMTSLGRSLEAVATARKDASGDDDDALVKQVANAKKTLDDAKMEAGAKPPAYAVVPYEGTLGTRRRPLYIECCGDGVFLQPEGIRLRPSDFEGPPGPGNPLASALRAARENLASRPSAAGTTEAQPYPLLLVRPSGVMAFYAAREAISSWGSDFGYQLVDEDWQLAFPPADPTLADVEQRAIDEARSRLQWLAEVRPKRPSKPTPKYRAATTRGGVVSTEGPSVLGDQSRFDWNDADADRAAGNSLGRGGSGFGGPGGTGAGQSTAGLAGPSGSSVPLGRGQAESLFVSGGTGRSGSNSGSGGGAGPLGGPTGQPSAGAGLLGSSLDSTAASSQEGTPGGSPVGTSASEGSSRFGSPVGVGEGDLDRRPASATAGQASSSQGGRGSGGPSSSGGASSDATAGGAASRSAAMDSSAGGSEAMAGGIAMPGLRQPKASQPGGPSGGSATISLARSRGSNWASLASAERPVPLSRPIQIECARDEFRFYDEARRRILTRVPIQGETSTAIDPLVKAVHDRVTTWGIAGDKMYWKPQLFLAATPDGEGRRDELERLLADSGIETFRRGSTVSPLPAVAEASESGVRQASVPPETASR